MIHFTSVRTITGMIYYIILYYIILYYIILYYIILYYIILYYIIFYYIMPGARTGGRDTVQRRVAVGPGRRVFRHQPRTRPEGARPQLLGIHRH